MSSKGKLCIEAAIFPHIEEEKPNFIVSNSDKLIRDMIILQNDLPFPEMRKLAISKLDNVPVIKEELANLSFETKELVEKLANHLITLSDDDLEEAISFLFTMV